MTIVLAFILGVGLVAIWWLAQQGLTSKPWLETGVVGQGPEDGPPTAKVGLGIFLVVVGGLFALVGSAFMMRMDYADWFQMILPRVVWINTGVLVLSSVFLALAVSSARQGGGAMLNAALAAGGLSTVAFLGGQLIAWRELIDSGQPLTAHPGASFFYVITGLHGLHILGGLVALGRAGARIVRQEDPARIRLSVELCATYWHFLLAIWLGMLVLLSGWAGDFVALCRAAFS